MPKQFQLNNLKVEKAKCPPDKPYKWFSDGNGLMLRVDSKQNKFWSVRLYASNKEHIRGIGSYPTIALKEARVIRDEYKKLWAKGVDPSIEKKKAKHTITNLADLTFEKAYQMYLDNKVVPNLSDKTISGQKNFIRTL